MTIPTFSQHSWKQEVQLADMKQGPSRKPVEGYVFNGGKRKFDDKVDKKKSYE